MLRGGGGDERGGGRRAEPEADAEGAGGGLGAERAEARGDGGGVDFKVAGLLLQGFPGMDVHAVGKHGATSTMGRARRRP